MKASRPRVVSSLRLADKFFDLVLSGVKTSTIRRGIFYFTHNKIPLVSNNRKLNIRVVRLDHGKTFGELAEEDAKRDGFESLEELKGELHRFYPELEDGDPVTIVYFEVDK